MTNSKRIAFTAMVPIFFVMSAGVTFGQVYVDGYQKNDGSYVQPHFRSQADDNPSNNWSNQGNRNPYTGEWGSKGQYSPQLNLPSQQHRPLAGRLGGSQQRTIRPDISTYGNPANYGSQGIRRTPLVGGPRR